MLSRPEFIAGKAIQRISSTNSIPPGKARKSLSEPGSPGQPSELRKGHSFHANDFVRGNQNSKHVAHFANSLRGDAPRDLVTTQVKRKQSSTKGSESGGSGLRPRGGGGRGGSGLRSRGPGGAGASRGDGRPGSQVRERPGGRPGGGNGSRSRGTWTRDKALQGAKDREERRKIEAEARERETLAKDPSVALAKDIAVSLRRVTAYNWNEKTLAKQRGWYYRDDTGEVQGPYPSSWMRSWHSEGHFDTEIEVCFGEPSLWFKIHHLWPESTVASFVLTRASTRVDAGKANAFLKHRLGA